LPLADTRFEVISHPEDATEADEQTRWQDRLDELIGRLPFDYGLVQVKFALELDTLDMEEHQRLARN
jgi:hypothetical protein